MGCSQKSTGSFDINFENFTINETAVKPYDLEYSLEFKVTYEEYPGRKTSFEDVSTVIRPGAPISDRVTLNILE